MSTINSPPPPDIDRRKQHFVFPSSLLSSKPSSVSVNCGPLQTHHRTATDVDDDSDTANTSASRTPAVMSVLVPSSLYGETWISSGGSSSVSSDTFVGINTQQTTDSSDESQNRFTTCHVRPHSTVLTCGGGERDKENRGQIVPALLDHHCRVQEEEEATTPHKLNPSTIRCSFSTSSYRGNSNTAGDLASCRSDHRAVPIASILAEMPENVFSASAPVLAGVVTKRRQLITPPPPPLPPRSWDHENNNVDYRNSNHLLGAPDKLSVLFAAADNCSPKSILNKKKSLSPPFRQPSRPARSAEVGAGVSSPRCLSSMGSQSSCTLSAANTPKMFKIPPPPFSQKAVLINNKNNNDNNATNDDSATAERQAAQHRLLRHEDGKPHNEAAAGAFAVRSSAPPIPFPTAAVNEPQRTFFIPPDTPAAAGIVAIECTTNSDVTTTLFGSTPLRGWQGKDSAKATTTTDDQSLATTAAANTPIPTPSSALRRADSLAVDRVGDMSRSPAVEAIAKALSAARQSSEEASARNRSALLEKIRQRQSEASTLAAAELRREDPPQRGISMMGRGQSTSGGVLASPSAMAVVTGRIHHPKGIQGGKEGWAGRLNFLLTSVSALCHHGKQQLELSRREGTNEATADGVMMRMPTSPFVASVATATTTPSYPPAVTSPSSDSSPLPPASEETNYNAHLHINRTPSRASSVILNKASATPQRVTPSRATSTLMTAAATVSVSASLSRAKTPTARSSSTTSTSVIASRLYPELVATSTPTPTLPHSEIKFTEGGTDAVVNLNFGAATPQHKRALRETIRHAMHIGHQMIKATSSTNDPHQADVDNATVSNTCSNLVLRDATCTRNVHVVPLSTAPLLQPPSSVSEAAAVAAKSAAALVVEDHKQLLSELTQDAAEARRRRQREAIKEIINTSRTLVVASRLGLTIRSANDDSKGVTEVSEREEGGKRQIQGNGKGSTAKKSDAPVATTQTAVHAANVDFADYQGPKTSVGIQCVTANVPSQRAARRVNPHTTATAASSATTSSTAFRDGVGTVSLLLTPQTRTRAKETVSSSLLSSEGMSPATARVSAEAIKVLFDRMAARSQPVDLATFDASEVVAKKAEERAFLRHARNILDGKVAAVTGGRARLSTTKTESINKKRARSSDTESDDEESEEEEEEEKERNHKNKKNNRQGNKKLNASEGKNKKTRSTPTQRKSNSASSLASATMIEVEEQRKKQKMERAQRRKQKRRRVEQALAHRFLVQQHEGGEIHRGGPLGNGPATRNSDEFIATELLGGIAQLSFGGAADDGFEDGFFGDSITSLIKGEGAAEALFGAKSDGETESDCSDAGDSLWDSSSASDTDDEFSIHKIADTSQKTYSSAAMKRKVKAANSIKGGGAATASSSLRSRAGISHSSAALSTTAMNKMLKNTYSIASIHELDTLIEYRKKLEEEKQMKKALEQARKEEVKEQRRNAATKQKGGGAAAAAALELTEVSFAQMQKERAARSTMVPIAAVFEEVIELDREAQRRREALNFQRAEEVGDEGSQSLSNSKAPMSMSQHSLQWASSSNLSPLLEVGESASFGTIAAVDTILAPTYSSAFIEQAAADEAHLSQTLRLQIEAVAKRARQRTTNLLTTSSSSWQPQNKVISFLTNAHEEESQSQRRQQQQQFLPRQQFKMNYGDDKYINDDDATVATPLIVNTTSSTYEDPLENAERREATKYNALFPLSPQEEQEEENDNSYNNINDAFLSVASADLLFDEW